MFEATVQSFTCVRHIIVKYQSKLNCGVFKDEVPLNLQEDKFVWYDGCTEKPEGNQIELGLLTEKRTSRLALSLSREDSKKD